MEKTSYLYGLLLLLGLSGSVFAAPYNCVSCSDCNAKISAAAAGDIVYLTVNVTSPSADCIELDTKTGITFDCKGNKITGGDAYEIYGIFLKNGSGNTVRNCKVSSFTHGIYVYYSDSNTITLNTANSNANGDGLLIMYSSHNTAANNSFTSNSEGILVLNSSYNTVSNNTITSNSQAGIELMYSNINTFTKNILSSNGMYGFSFVSSSDNAANMNRACSHSTQDIHIDDAAGNTGSGNTCDKTDGWNDTGASGCAASCGGTTTTSTSSTTTSTATTSTVTSSTTTTTVVSCNSCANCNSLIKAASPGSVITLAANITNQASSCINFNRTSAVTLECNGNSITGTLAASTSGVVFNSSTGCIVQNCKLSRFYFGVYNYYSSNSTVVGSTVYNNSMDGLYSYYSDSLTANANVFFADGWMAVNLYYSNNTHLSFNLIGNTSYGIQLKSSTKCGLTSNIVSNNTYAGVHIDTAAGGNTLTNNMVCGNGLQDFNNSLSPGNSGTNNYCDKPDSWNDTGRTGCTYNCSSTASTCDSCASCNDLIKNAARGSVISLAVNLSAVAGDCILFNQTSGIIFDCKGNSITGSFGSSVAVDVQGGSNNTVRNCELSNFYNGIRAYYSPYVFYGGNYVHDNLNYGIFLNRSDRSTLYSNMADYNEMGIYSMDSHDGLMQDNTAIFNVYGIVLQISTRNLLVDNSAYNNSLEGITFDVSCNNNTLQSNRIRYNIGKGMTFLTSANNSLESNDFCFNGQDLSMTGSVSNVGTDNTCDVPGGWNDTGRTGCTYRCSGAARTCDSCGTCNDAIKASSAGDTVSLTANISNQAGTCIEFNGTQGVTFDCQNNSIHGLDAINSFGVAIRNSLSDKVENCAISNFYDGILLSYTNYSVLKDNFVRNNSADSGIILTNSVNNTITGNTIIDNVVGIWLSGSDGTNVTDNNVRYNRDALQVSGSGYGRILRNEFSDNTEYGMYLYNTASKNLISNNDVWLNRVNGIYLKSSASNTVNSNSVCHSGGTDYALGTSVQDSGINNTCDEAGTWNDLGISGCTYACSGITNKFCSTCSTCSQMVQTSGPGTIVYLTANLSGQSSTCVNFYKTVGVTLDCQGNGISGSLVSWTSGVVFNLSSGCIVRNCRLSKFYLGAYSYFSNNSALTGSTVYNNSQDGIYVYYSHYITINSSVFYSDGWMAMNLYNSNHSVVSSNSVSSTSYGIQLRGANNCVLTGNTVNNNTYSGVHIDVVASGNTLNNNVVCWNGIRDFNNSLSSGNGGTENTCDKVRGWNDNGKTNCTYACSTVNQCSLKGDYPPCGAITVQEILNLITQWAQGKATVADVLALITAWAKG